MNEKARWIYYMSRHAIRNLSDFFEDPVLFLHDYLKSLLNCWVLRLVIGATVFMNPIAILPQMVAAITAPDISGISVSMWYIFVAIQVAFILQGIKTKSPAVFYSMLISLVESATIIGAILIRS